MGLAPLFFTNSSKSKMRGEILFSLFRLKRLTLSFQKTRNTGNSWDTIRNQEISVMFRNFAPFLFDPVPEI